MSRISYNNYGEKTKNFNSYLEIASRYEFMKDSEKFIIEDIVNKLELKSSDRFIDVGCGAGNLTIKLSSFVSEVNCVDHPNCLKLLSERQSKARDFKMIPGNFLDIELHEKFDKVLCYSVIHYLQDYEEIWNFIEKFLAILKPGGIVLIGDIPNISKKNRFMNTEFGKKKNDEYQNLLKKEPKNNKNKIIPDNDCVVIDDLMIINILKNIRDLRFNAYIVDQPKNLSLAYTREDIIIKKPEK